MSLFGDPSESQQFGSPDVWAAADEAMGFIDAQHVPEAHVQSKAVLTTEQEVAVINDTADLEAHIRSTTEPLHEDSKKRPFFGALSSSTWAPVMPPRADQSLAYAFPTDKEGAHEFQGGNGADSLHPAYAEGQWEHNQRDVIETTTDVTAPMREPTLLLRPGDAFPSDGSEWIPRLVLIVVVVVAFKLLAPDARAARRF